MYLKRGRGLCGFHIFLFGVQLFYNVVSVYAVQQSESALQSHTFPLLLGFLPIQVITEAVKQSEVSQKEENKYCILMPVESIKMVQMILLAKQKQRHRCREQMHGHQGENWGYVMNWEIGVDICTLLILCIKYITNENLLYSSGYSTQCSVVT